MNSELYNLDSLLRGAILRIPDYQRGYAWETKEINEFWEDIELIRDNRLHYAGVLTLEPVKEEIYKSWHADLWLINNRNIKPYYVVDGQQRLTTSMILLSVIINIMKQKYPNDFLDDNRTTEEVIKTYIMQSNVEDRSFIFSYETNNDSYGFYVENILNQKIDINAGVEISDNKYTKNLKFAYDFFLDKCNKLNIKELNDLFRKLAYNMVFNRYVISDNLDIFVTFETMNNRGKLLSRLELLKNRLIYLTTLFSDNDYSPQNKKILRTNINNCWKHLFQVLGSNPLLKDSDFVFSETNLYIENINSDDLFLAEQIRSYKKFDEEKFLPPKNEENSQEHYRFFYERERNNHIDAGNILRYVFSAQNVSNGKLTPSDIKDYITDLSSSIDFWYAIQCPFDTNVINDVEVTKLIDNIQTLNSIQSSYSYRLDRYFNRINSFLYRIIKEESNVQKIKKLFSIIEKICFIGAYHVRSDSQQYRDKVYLEHLEGFYSIIYDELERKTMKPIEDIIQELKQVFYPYKNYFENGKILKTLKRSQFYGKHNQLAKYILFEYEIYLLEKSNPINLSDELRRKYFEKKMMNIEHIYPKNGKNEYWKDRFSKLSDKEKNSYKNCLPNLLLIGIDKNRALENKEYPLKRENQDFECCYLNGNFSERKLANKYIDWDISSIESRGKELNDFIKERWEIEFKNGIEKIFMGF